MKLTKNELRTIIKEELGRLNEASEIEFSELDSKSQKLIQTLSKQLRVGKVNVVWSGIHGKIVSFNNDRQPGTYRISIDEIKKLSKLPIRWIESSNDELNIGF